ncbi:MAG: histidine kinase [Pseudomonadota bacterium]
MSIPSRPPAIRPTERLPDFRNQGVWLRLLLAANILLLAAALTANRTLARLPDEVMALAAWVEPALLLTLAVLFLLAPRLRAMPDWLAAAVVVGLALAATAGVRFLLAGLLDAPVGWRSVLAAGCAAALMLYWHALHTRARTPALAEARLTALTARIRPHFLFNSLNAVLGVMRAEPRRAEVALEELSELFRALMRDNTDLTLLSGEIELARKYLDIERLRLGERLQVHWEVDACPPDALAPPLLLQPLLENAVYHGIEPAAEPGEIRVRIATTRDGIRIEIDNPCGATTGQRQGNHMALDNLRERLMLFYDLEARLDTGTADGRYFVRIDLPKRSGA